MCVNAVLVWLHFWQVLADGLVLGEQVQIIRVESGECSGEKVEWELLVGLWLKAPLSLLSNYSLEDETARDTSSCQ